MAKKQYMLDLSIKVKIKGVIRHYVSFGYKDKKEAFIKYWELIRK